MSLAAGWRPPVVRRLASGLTVGLVERRQAPIVFTVVCYRAGAAAEPGRLAGLAHFLEHMMFKGSGRYGPGEVDRVTQRLGGSNNAYTGHDATFYEFGLAADHWREALAIEADRMAGLRLDPDQVAAEREVILEELSMVEDEPWEALELAVMAERFGRHPYGRPVLGRRDSLRRIGVGELAAFHQRHYRPAGAVVVVAGDVGEEAFAEVERRFAGVDREGGRGAEGTTRAAAEEASPAPSAGRVRLRRGELARLMVALPAAAADRSGYAELRLVLTALAGGRTSRLHRLLVDDRRLCSSVGASIGESVEPGVATVSCELLPGSSPEAVERLLLDEMARLAVEGPSAAELARARRQLAADWVFARDRVGEEALATATAIALFDPDHERRHLERIEGCAAAEVAAAAAGALDSAGLTIGWSLPEEGS